MVVHDYSGFPFPVQLSRELARRGHQVLHLHCPSYRAGKGDLELHDDDPETLEIEPISMGAQFAKYSPATRLRQELTYGDRAGRRIREARPDVVLSADTPLFAQSALVRSCRRKRIPFVFWLQDFYSIAMQLEVERRLRFGGRPVGKALVGLERKALMSSSAVVAISEDFRTTLLAWRIPEERVVVASEGLGADWLAERPRENLRLLGFQPYDELPDVLGAGDILVVILEREAGRFAVPSKVLSYLCAGRPLLAALPPDNLAAKVVESSGAGVLVEPDDAEGLIAGARRLLEDDALRAQLGEAGRAYAERTFDIAAIGDRFEEVLVSVSSRS